jgi:hypothetical protein
MKDERRTILTLVAIALTIVTSSALTLPTLAAGEARVYLNPSQNVFPETTPLGTKFTVTIGIENVANLGAAQVHLEFDDTVLNVTRWFEPKDDPLYVFYGKNTLAQPDTENDTNYRHLTTGMGMAEIAVLDFDPAPYFTGSGIICIFEFNITTGPPPPVLTSVLTLHNSTMHGYTYLLDGDTEDEIPLTLEDGSYTFVPEFIPLLALSLLVASTTIAVLLKRMRATQKLLRF